MFYPLLCCHRQDEVRNTTPQSTVLVKVHPVKRHWMAIGEELLLKMVVHHFLHSTQTSVGRNLLFLPQQYREDQTSLLVGGVLVVAVAIKNKRGARRQLLEAVNDSHGFVSFKSSLQLAVDVQFDLVAVLAGFAGSVDVQEGGVEGGGEGGGQALSQAVQRPLSPAACSKDQTDWLCRMGCFQMLLQVDLAPLPQVRPLTRKLSLKKRQLVCKYFWRSTICSLFEYRDDLAC